MRVVYPGEVDAISPALDEHALIKKHAHAHLLQLGYHRGAVVIAEDTKEWALKGVGDRSQLRKRAIEGAEGLSPEIAGDNAEVIFEGFDEIRDVGHRSLAHIDMQIAKLEHREAAKGLG
jgi:hypothetical protein